jgi:hypothetical protein
MRHVVTQHIKEAVCTFLSISLAASLVAAAPKPDFSGKWEMNASKSAFGPIPIPTSLIRTIIHAEPSLTITEEQKGGSGDHVSTRQYSTDGKQSTFQESGAVVNATATWDGGSLVIRSTAETGGVAIVFTERMTLSNENKTLTDAVHIETPQGGLDATYSFDKR